MGERVRLPHTEFSGAVPQGESMADTATTNKFVKMFMDGMVGAITSSWRFSVDIDKK